MTVHAAASLTLDSPRGPGVGSAISSEFVKLTSVPRQRVLLVGAIGAAVLMAAVFYVSLPVTQGRGLSELNPGEFTANDGGEAAYRQRLRYARHALEQTMALGKQSNH